MYTVTEMQGQIAKIREHSEHLADGTAKTILLMQLQEADRILAELPEPDAHLTAEQYAYTQVCRTAGMYEMLRIVQNET